MNKWYWSAIGVTALMIAVLMAMPAIGHSQESVACEQDIIVKANDSISKIAESVYGDPLTFPAIIQATNAMVASDDSYPTIDNAGIIEIGWKLCIPSEADAQAILATTGPVALQVDPSVDRVGFPDGYQQNFSVFYEFDRPDNKSARVIYANEAAASVQPGEAFPYGSVLAMEVYRTQRDDGGNVVLDENGRYVRDELFGLFVMRKERGFGANYGELRNGEWEYVAYRPDGTVFIPPERTTSCAACHMESGLGNDWVFGAFRHFGEAAPEPAANQVSIRDYAFTPEAITIKVGEEVEWVGHDVVFHTVTANDLSFSGMVRPQTSFRHTFEQPGEFEYFSAAYPSVKGRVIVTE